MPKKIPKIPRDHLLEHLVESMLNQIGLTVFDAIFEPKWRELWTLNKDQYSEWKKYCMNTMKKSLKFNNTKAKETFKWLEDNFGLKVK